MAQAKTAVKLQERVVTDSDRLRFAIFLAIAVHFLLIFGVRFVLPSAESSPVPLSLDVTLAHRASLEAPENPDFVGQNNQIGAGSAEQAERPTTELEHFKTTEGVTATPSLEVDPQQAKMLANQSLVTSSQGNRTVNANPLEEPKPIEQTVEELAEISPDPELLKQMNLEQDLQDKLDTRGIKEEGIAASVMASPDEAPYLEAWRNKVLAVGNRHYIPISQKLGQGSPTVRVVIGKQGELLAVSIEKASGNALIDETAKELIRLAAPFDPLPESIRQQKNTLEIVRVMNFDPGRGVNSSSSK
ncbi:energy transducer TonB [Kangiella sp. TOML190]|uniref:energy transducer TonB family protein n=1 Tax=Kangiella sp. TOML190 TaxID=2931351 RepID=UPI00203E3F13|nr:energy transducer TonB [Kangiella sp. TOML190]